MKQQGFIPREKLLSLGSRNGRTYAEIAIELGFKFGTPDFRKAIGSLRWWFTPEDVKLRKRKATYARRKERYRTDENYRQAQRDRFKSVKRKERAKDPEKVRSRGREYYARNREDQIRKILSNRRRRNPVIGLASSILDFKAGRIDLRELDRRISAAIAQCDVITRGKQGEGVS